MAKGESRCRQLDRADATVVWDEPDDPRGNRRKVWDHGLTEDEVESVLLDEDALAERSKSHPQNCLAFGYTYTDRYIIVAWEILDENEPVIRPITAYEPEK